jgi:hypothetical protein
MVTAILQNLIHQWTQPQPKGWVVTGPASSWALATDGHPVVITPGLNKVAVYSSLEEATSHGPAVSTEWLARMQVAQLRAKLALLEQA